MAAGALDTNGVWQYGEDDQRDTFSALLNIGQDATSDAIGSDREHAWPHSRQPASWGAPRPGS